MLRLHTRQIHDPLVRLVAARASEADGHAHFGRSFDQRVGHVVAVSDVGQLYAVQGALLLPHGEQIGERLHGWHTSVSPLMTGIVACRAHSSTVAWS